MSMDADIEIEDDYIMSQADKIEDAGSVYYKILFAALLLVAYFCIQRFSTAIGAMVARHVTGGDRQNYDDEMREARRRLQERFDAERRKRVEMKKEEKLSSSELIDRKPQTETQDQTMPTKPPKPKLQRDEYFPLMGSTSSSRVCLRRSRNTGG